MRPSEVRERSWAALPELDHLAREPASLLLWPVLDQVDGHTTTEDALQVGLELAGTVRKALDHEVAGLRRPPVEPSDPVPVRHLEDLGAPSQEEVLAGRTLICLARRSPVGNNHPSSVLQVSVPGRVKGPSKVRRVAIGPPSRRPAPVAGSKLD